MIALVTGATGYIGSRLVPVLLRSGWQVLAGARDPDKLTAFNTTAEPAPDQQGPNHRQGDRTRRPHPAPPGATGVQLDVTDPDSCRAALTDHGRVDVAYYLVHGLGEGDFAATDLRAAEVFARAAAAAGVRRIVYLGGLVPPGEELSEHLRSRQVVAHALQQHSGPNVEVVWLRAAIVLGAGSTSYELIRHLVRRLSVIPTPSWMSHQVQPIAVDDVLHHLLHAAEPRLPAGGYDIGGPQALAYRDLVALQAQVTGQRRLLVPVPWVSTTVAAKVIAAVVPLPSHLVHDLVDSLNNTMVAREDRITTYTRPPADGWTDLEAALRRSAASPGDAELRGAGQTADPLHRTRTDPDWAG